MADSKPVYEVTITAEFGTKELRAKFLDQVRGSIADDELRSTEMKTRATSCRLCGIDRKFQTLGSGIAGISVDECRPSFAAACQRRQEPRNG